MSLRLMSYGVPENMRQIGSQKVLNTGALLVTSYHILVKIW